MLLPWQGTTPAVDREAFVAPGAVLIGDVAVGAGSSIFFNCTLRGDVNHIRVGAQSNIQDGTVIHVSGQGSPTIIGDRVSIGHSVLLHACTLEDEAFVGMGAVVMDDCVVEGGGMVAAGALLTPGKHIRRGELWAGRPAKLWREMSPDAMARNMRTWQTYYDLSRKYLADGIGRV